MEYSQSMADLISIIVPVYKVEPYLRKCVDSILAQTYQNFELILVDDGSPDNCPAICDEYAMQDARIRVIHKENGDVSTARNAGLDICLGEYITFIDSDDWVEPGYVEVLYKALLAYDADFAQCNVRIVHLGGQMEILRNNLPDNMVLDKLAAVDAFVDDGWRSGINDLVWGKLYKRKCFEILRFHKGRYHEDDIAVCDVLTADSFAKAVVVNDVLVNYLEREVCRSKVITPKELVDRYYSFLHVKKKIPPQCARALAVQSGEIFRRVMELAMCSSNRVLPVSEVLNERPDFGDILKDLINQVSLSQVRAAGGSWCSVALWMLLKLNLKFGLWVIGKACRIKGK